jgi:cytoskeletal protein RodZ
MGFNLQSSSCMILLVCLLAVSVLGMIGFLNNVYAADNMTVGSNMSMNADVNANTSMTGNMTENVNASTSMTGNTNESTSVTNTQKILPPLQQFKSGVAAKSVQCNEGYSLIIKAEDGSPACVTSQIAQTLTARGWGMAP